MDFKDRCYVCNHPIEHAYQVKIIIEGTGNINFVKCCSLEHAEEAKSENASIHKSRYEDVKNQSIQKLN